MKPKFPPQGKIAAKSPMRPGMKSGMKSGMKPGMKPGVKSGMKSGRPGAMPTKPFASGGSVDDKKAAEYARQAREAKSADAPVKLNPQEAQAVKDDKARRAAAKAPTTRTGMGKAFAKGGSVDGCAKRGKTRGKVM